MQKNMVYWLCCLLLGATMSARAEGGSVRGKVVDGESGEPLIGAIVRLQPLSKTGKARGTVTDSVGRFQFELPMESYWKIVVEALGYERAQRQVRVEADGVEVNFGLLVEPLMMDEMLVQARREEGQRSTPAFVEVIEMGEHRPGFSLPELLDQAVGVDIRSSGGLGSFSTVSIRGSTAEQVQIYLDGVPLNQATGGGVDMSDLPVEGVESIEIYRGAVPARFGGNSIGGVVHIRTRDLVAGRRLRGQATTGAWGTRQVSGSLEGTMWGRKYMLLGEYAESDNDFTFLDDNGTEYNADDDEPARRLNNDIRSLRTLVKTEQRIGRSRLQMHNSFDIKHQGIPSISNNQSLDTRLNKWRSVSEAELYGALPGVARTGYRFTAYHLLQQYEYEDIHGTVGVGAQHDRNTTTGVGLRAELNRLLFGEGVLTLFAGTRREEFDPKNLLRPESRLLASKRRGGTAGWEAEVPLWRNLLQVTCGSQVERIDDSFYGENLFGVSQLTPDKENTESLVGGRIGGKLRLGIGWALKGHRGWHQRPPSFYELFGDRGAVVGNTDLKSEEGDNWDIGLVWNGTGQAATGLQLLEATYFHNGTENMIRFIQNAQRVSRPGNIGRSRVRGAELRSGLRLFHLVDLTGNYTYQQAENRTDVSYERGKDLPNSPRHTLNLRIGMSRRWGAVHYESNRESRLFLDKANLRAVPGRTIRSLGGSLRPGSWGEWSLEIRNLTGNQLADLWGYPLPGRSYFISCKKSVELISR